MNDSGSRREAELAHWTGAHEFPGLEEWRRFAFAARYGQPHARFSHDTAQARPEPHRAVPAFEARIRELDAGADEQRAAMEEQEARDREAQQAAAQIRATLDGYVLTEAMRDLRREIAKDAITAARAKILEALAIADEYS